MNFSAFIQRLFPGKHSLYNFFVGFSLGLALINPYPTGVSKSTWLVVYGILMLILGLCIYYFRPKEGFVFPDGWRALGLAASGILFWALPVFDWLDFLNNPIAMIAAGAIALLLCAIYTLWQISHSQST